MKIMKEKKGIAKLFLLVLVFFLGMFFVEGNDDINYCKRYAPDFEKEIDHYSIYALDNLGDGLYVLKHWGYSNIYFRFSYDTWEWSPDKKINWVRTSTVLYDGRTPKNSRAVSLIKNLEQERKNLLKCSIVFDIHDLNQEEEEDRINGECGPAKGVYEHNDNNFREPFCNEGKLSGNEPNFPEPGNSVTWTCEGKNEGEDATCTARRNSIPGTEEETGDVCGSQGTLSNWECVTEHRAGCHNPGEHGCNNNQYCCPPESDDNGGQNGNQKDCVGTKPTGNGYDFGDDTHTDEGDKSWTYVDETPGPCEYTCKENYDWDTETNKCIEKQETDVTPRCNDAELDDNDECICHLDGPVKGDEVTKNHCRGYCKNCYEGTNCYCPLDCLTTGLVDDATKCRGVNTQSCTSLGGECMTPDNCQKRDENEELKTFQNQEDLCEEGKVCCDVRDGNQRSLRDCSSFCNVAAGCKCNKNCQTRTSFNGSKITYTPGEDYTVPIHFNCLGYHKDDPFRLSECNNEQKDGICPAHCFWWNDLDCGIQANIIDVLWDYTGLADWWAETSYVQKVQEFANYLTFDYWAESICNPLVKMRQRVQPITDGYFTHYDTHGWISGIMDLHNETHYVYTMSYYLSNLRQDNNYRIEYRGDNTFKYPFEEADNVYKIDNNYWFNVTANSVVQNTSITFTDEKEYRTICMIFKDEMDLGGYEIKEFCRGINVEW